VHLCPATLIASLLLALVASACIPPAPEQTLERTYNEATTMGQIQAAGSLRIGITSAAPPLGYARAHGGGPAGFTVTLGREVAATLDVRPEFLTDSPGALLDLIDSGKVDIAFPNLPLTEERVRAHSFTAPYLVTHQRLLVPATSEASSFRDLSGGSVCSAINETTQVPPGRLEPTVRVVSSDPSGCLKLLRTGKVAAVTAAEVYLTWIRSELGGGGARIVGDDLSTEGYGAAVTTGGGWLPFVDAVLAAAESDGTWARAHERWIGPSPDEPPQLSAEEAAALFPSTDPQ
jgi:polar amino acid transport system substrate-binding protein